MLKERKKIDFMKKDVVQRAFEMTQRESVS